MTKIIGLTGGIGSGKTTIANYLATRGVPVFISDDVAKKSLEKAIIKNAIKDSFGAAVLDNNEIDRKVLSELVFSNPEKLKILNSIIHPEVKKQFSDWLKLHSNQQFVVKEAAILFESGSYKDCDYIISVVAPEEMRIKRVIERDATSIKAIQQRIKNQWTDEQRIAKSDFVIHNTSIENAYSQVNQILNILNIS
jgi:dephospho-CoA kinase